MRGWHRDRRRVGARTGRAAAVALLAAGLLAPGGARATVEGRAELRAGLLRFEYSEHDDRGAFLDGEHGWLPAVAGEVEVRSGGLFARGSARLAQGSVTYHGQTQSPDPTLDALPLRSDTETTFVGGELEGGLVVDPVHHLALLVAVGARRWTRDIRSSSVIARDGTPATVVGLSEIYSWYELEAGARWAFLSRPRTTWDLEARVVRTAAAEVSVDLAQIFGVDGTAHLALGSRTGWRLASTLRQDLDPAIFLVATLYAEGYGFGESRISVVRDAGGVARGISEPRSDSVVGGLELGIGGRF